MLAVVLEETSVVTSLLEGASLLEGTSLLGERGASLTEEALDKPSWKRYH